MNSKQIQPLARIQKAIPSPALGGFYAFIAFLAWGIIPIYWKQINKVSSMEIVGHRIIWTFISLTLILSLAGKLKIKKLLSSPQDLKKLLLSALLIGGNWFLFIWAVNNGQILQTSFGYYINPLMNVVLGRFILGENLRREQKWAVYLALTAVAILALRLNSFPWISVNLALSFSLYGLIKKRVQCTSMEGLIIESAYLCPLAILFFLIKGGSLEGVKALLSWGKEAPYLIGAGIITSLPLLWFSSAAKSLTLGTLGFFQYIAPTISGLIAVFFYKEEFTDIHAIVFTLIIIALIIYSYDAYLFTKKQNSVK